MFIRYHTVKRQSTNICLTRFSHNAHMCVIDAHTYQRTQRVPGRHTFSRKTNVKFNNSVLLSAKRTRIYMYFEASFIYHQNHHKVALKCVKSISTHNIWLEGTLRFSKGLSVFSAEGPSDPLIWNLLDKQLRDLDSCPRRAAVVCAGPARRRRSARCAGHGRRAGRRRWAAMHGALANSG